MEICAMSLDMPVVEGHPNRIPFHGVLTYVGTESDKAPSGARGHRIILTRTAVIQALPSLLGMSVGFKAGWDGHDYRQKCGIITAAELVGSELKVAGYVFKRDFPEVETKSKSHELGMSYELENAHVKDMRQAIWTVTKFTFNGAAILLKDKAAYKATSFTIGESWPQKQETLPKGSCPTFSGFPNQHVGIGMRTMTQTGMVGFRYLAGILTLLTA